MAAVALVTTAACSNGDSVGDDQQTTSTTTSTVVSRAPTIKEVARIDAMDVSYIDLFGGRVTWTTAAKYRERHDQAMVHDLRTGKTTVAARASRRGTAIEWSRGSRDTLVFTEQDNEGTDIESGATGHWRVVMLDLASGKREVLDQDRGADDQLENPTVEIDWPWVAWIRPSKTPERLDVIARNLETGESSTAAAAVDVSNLHVVDDNVVYIAGSAAGRDLFAVELPNGKPKPLTTSGQVSRAGKAGGNQIGYEEPLEEDPTRLLVVPVSGGRPIELRNQRTAGSNIVTGDGFALWFSGEGTATEVSTIGRQAPSITVAKNRSVGARLSADGRRAAWGDLPDRQADPSHTVIVVAEVG